MQSNVVGRELLERRGGRAGGDDLDVVAGEQPRGALAQQRIVLDDQHAAQLLRELGLELLDRLDELLALDRLERVAGRAHLAARSACSRRPRPCGPGCGGSRASRLSASSTARPERSGRPTSSTIALGRYWRASARPSSAVVATITRNSSSWARSKSTRANARSSSMTSSERDCGVIVARSSGNGGGAGRRDG